MTTTTSTHQPIALQGQLQFELPTQEAQVMRVLSSGPSSANHIADVLGLIRHSVRRILGMGTKAGKFERISRGIYGLRNANGSFLYVESANAITALPKLAESGLKADFVFLDPPYKTAALVGGNRGVKDYDFISPEQFSTVVQSVKAMMRTPDSPVYFMFSKAPSGMKQMQKYIDVFEHNGLKMVREGAWTKTFKDGSLVTNPRGQIAAPEGIALFNQSGNLPDGISTLDFTMVRPKVSGSDGRQSQKPAELYEGLLRPHTSMLSDTERIRFLAIDPFAGTGNLAIAARRQGVSAVLLELLDDVIQSFIGPKVDPEWSAVDGLEDDIITGVA